jgi:hypothetical protein
MHQPVKRLLVTGEMVDAAYAVTGAVDKPDTCLYPSTLRAALEAALAAAPFDVPYTDKPFPNGGADELLVGRCGNCGRVTDRLPCECAPARADLVRAEEVSAIYRIENDRMRKVLHDAADHLNAVARL